jgi:hypothetical protein
MFRLTVVWDEKPWWGFGILVREHRVSMLSPPDCTRETAEAMRAMAAMGKGVTSAHLEVVDP